MAIRPTDIQGSIWQASQTAPLAQREQEAPRAAQAAAQSAFAAQLERRQETVGAAGEVQGNRVDANGARDRGGSGERREQQRAFERVVDDASGDDEPPHLVDVTA